MKRQNIINSIFIVIISLITLGSGCEKIVYRRSSIIVENNAVHDMNFYLAVGGDKGIIYPDTLPINLKPPFPVAKAGQNGYNYFGFSKEELFKQLPSDTLSVFLIHPDTLAKYSWQEIINDYKVKRYDLSLGDLERLNFRVPYPPTQQMRGMKMYPRQ